MKKHLFILSFLLGLCPNIFGQTAEDAVAIQNIVWQEKEIQPGIKLRKCEKVNIFNYPQCISIIEVDTAVAKVDFKIDYSNAGFHPVSVFGRRNKAIAAINGTYFMTTGASMYTPWHFIKIDGKKISSTVTNEFSTRATGVFTVTDGKADISFWNQDKEATEAGNASYALVCGPLLLDDGQDSEIWQPDPTNTSGLSFIGTNPRSCVGMTGDGRVMIMTIDGRQPGRAYGMTMNQLQFFARQLGCTDAMNLDGGGSSALYVDGEPNNGIVNVPIDENIPGKERNVGNILYITPKDGTKPFCVSGQIPGGLQAKNLRLWIKADGEVHKNSSNQLESPYIFDYTGYNDFNFQGVDGNAKIAWEESGLNDRPSLAFDSASVLIAKRKVPYTTIFSVNTINDNGTVLGFDESGSSFVKYREYLHAESGMIYVHEGSSTATFPSIVFTPTLQNRLNIYSTSFGKRYDSFKLNGQEQMVATSNLNKRANITGLLQVGARNTYPYDIPGQVDSYFKGNLSEVIAFTDTLTDSETNRVESYLAMKYGITMLDPQYTYQSSTGQKWWNGVSSSFQPYSNFITFIGRDDASGLFQLRAKGYGNQLSATDEAMLTLTNSGVTPDNLYFLTAGVSVENLTDAAIQSDYKVMARNWKFNCSTMNSLATDVTIDLPAVLQFNEASLGVLFLKGTTYTYFPGTYDAAARKLSVPGLTIPKSSQMFLVLDKVTAGIETANTTTSNIVYDRSNHSVYASNAGNVDYKLYVYSASGSLVAAASNKIDTSSLSQGAYIIVLKSNNGSTLQRLKVLIAQ